MFIGIGVSCTDESTYPIDFDQVNNSNGGILSQVQVNSVAFDKFDIPNAVYDVVFEANDRDRGKLFTKMEMFVSFLDRTPANGDASADEVPIGTYQASEFVVDATTGLPRLRVIITAPDAMAALGLTAIDLEGSDQFVFRQEMHFPNGQVFTSNNVNTAIASLGGVYKSPFANGVAVVCPSDLGGTVNYSSTILLAGGGSSGSGVPAGCGEPIVGTTEFTVDGPGVYLIGDASFGLWNATCLQYGDSEGNVLSDACNVLSISGTDQYGDSYTWSIVSNDGTTLVINWGNTWGDGGRVALTRTGKTWPLGLTF